MSVSARETTGGPGLGVSGGPQAANAIPAVANANRFLTLGTSDAQRTLHTVERCVDLGVTMRGGQEAGLER